MVVRFSLLAFTFISVFLGNAQVKNGDIPNSWKGNIYSKRSMTPVVLKEFDLLKLKQEDAINDLDKSIPWRFGHELDVFLGLHNACVWDELPYCRGRILLFHIIAN